MTDYRSIAQESLVLLADIGLTYLFYRLYKSKCTAADKIKELTVLDISDVHSDVEYGMVEGPVKTVDTPLKSYYTEATGPIRYSKTTLLKSERHRGYWVSTTTTVSENYDKVPFSLKPRDSSGASVLVTDARSADFIDSAMHTTYDEFRPTVRTVAGNLYDRIVGDITKGVRTTETLLKEGTVLLGVGKLVFRNGGLELRKPTQSHTSYILTSMGKEELIDYLKSKAFVYKLISGVFGIAGIFIFWVTFGSRIRGWLDSYRSRRALNEIREQLTRARSDGPSAPPSDDDTSNANSCVICLSGGRQLAFRPCGHVCCCLDCYEAIPAPRLCPVCRAPVNEIIPIFIS